MRKKTFFLCDLKYYLLECINVEKMLKIDQSKFMYVTRESIVDNKLSHELKKTVFFFQFILL